jgi:hypothetical protein
MAEVGGVGESEGEGEEGPEMWGGERDRKILMTRKIRMTRMTTVPVTELNRQGFRV